MTNRMLPLAMTAALLAGCNESIKPNPMVPTSPVETNPLGPKIDLSMWSPYIVIHTPNEALTAYQNVFPELMASGALEGARIGIIKGDDRNLVNAWIASRVPDVLWILDNYYLFEPNIESVIDQVFRWYPTIHYLQIGNETITILPRDEPQIPIEMYMGVFKRIYSHVQNRYPGVTLLTQSTFGSGSIGSVELEKMVELGLKDIPPSKLIIAINDYSVQAAYQYSHVVDRPLRGYRIWVTEAGISDPGRHIGYVQQTYPFLKNTLRAERIYWYCLYCGETGGDSAHGLIRNILGPSLWKSPLYVALTRGQQ